MNAKLQKIEQNFVMPVPKFEMLCLYNVFILTFDNTAGVFFDKVEVVSCHYYSGTFLSYSMKMLDNLLACIGVEIAGWLVG